MKTSNTNKERDDIKLIYFTINKLRLGYMQDEIIDVAYIGYTRALNTYNEEKGSFSTYAYTCIKNEIGHYLAMKNNDVRKANNDVLSLNYVADDNDNDNELIDLIKDDYDLESNTTNKILVEEICKVAKEVLTDKQYKVFNLCYVIGYKDYETAKILGVSRERIRQIKISLLTRLKRNKRIQRLKEDQ